MSKSKDLIKKQSEAITQNTVANIITVGLAWGGAVVMSSLAAYSGFLSGLPLYSLIFWGAVIFLILAAALNFIHLFIVRRRRLKVPVNDETSLQTVESNEKIIATHNAHQAEKSELERQITTLKEQLDGANKYIAQFAWLHNIASAQVNAIDSYVMLDRIERGDFQFHDGVPFVKFGIYVTNNSVFDVSVELERGSYIVFKDTKLISPIDVVSDNLSNVGYQTTRCLVIEQRLSAEEAHYIASHESKDDANFYFDKLIMIIKGSAHQPPIPSKRLDINKGVTLHNKPLLYRR
jgi:hypothetical protein